jgi:DNA-binding LacI/PurR family transcriptional regulator
MGIRQMKNAVSSTRQLADTLGLSRWTVSRALNGHKGLHPATVERVRSAAKTHGFAPSILGRGLRSGKTNLMGVCVPDLEDYFLTEKVMRLQRAVAVHGLDVMLQISDGTPESENAALERFASLRCRGVTVIASRLGADGPGWRCLAAADIPVVRIDGLTSGTGRTADTDRASGMKRVVHHLHDLGHRGIAGVGINADTPYGRQRVEGLIAGAKEAGWNPDRQIHFWNLPPEKEPWKPYQSHPVTALVALNDRVALRLVRWAGRCGLRIPADLSIVGFDNAEIAAISRPSLTTVDPRADLLVERAVRLLFAPKTSRIRIQPEIVIRESTGPAPKPRKKIHVRS